MIPIEKARDFGYVHYKEDIIDFEFSKVFPDLLVYATEYNQIIEPGELRERYLKKLLYIREDV
ncbi:hypothetical protein D3C76_1705660 [compost metagenome]